MTFNKYQKETLRTASGMNIVSAETANSYILNDVMGLNGEAGEVIDVVKKHIFQGHELDKEHIAEELGDCLWYIAVTAEGIGYSLEAIAIWNIRKLQKRYPNGFEIEKSVNR